LPSVARRFFRPRLSGAGRSGKTEIPLARLLAARERQKGTPLTEAEVLEVRDGAACTQMPLSQAERLYAALDAQMPIPRLHPERIWEEWQAVREQVV
jgi:hypothetical protein